MSKLEALANEADSDAYKKYFEGFEGALDQGNSTAALEASEKITSVGTNNSISYGPGRKEELGGDLAGFMGCLDGDHEERT